MEFMRGQFEKKLGEIAESAEVALNALVSVKDITNMWSIINNMDSDEFVYMFTIGNLPIGLIVYSTIDLKTNLSRQEKSIRIGFYRQRQENAVVTREYADFGYVRNTDSLDTRLSIKIKSALWDVTYLADNKHNKKVKWKHLT